MAVVDVGSLLAVEVGLGPFGAGAEEDADDGAGLLVAGDLDLVAEGLVVETHGLGDVVELDHLVDGGDVDGVGHVNVEEVEVGDELVDGNVLDGDAGEVEVIGLVGGQVVLVLLEETDHVLLEDVEGGVAEGGLVVANDAGGDAVLLAGVHDEGEQVADHGLVGAVIAGVDGVLVALDDVAEDVDSLDVLVDGDLVAVLAEHEAGVDGVLDPLLDGLDVLDGVRLDAGEVLVGSADGELGAVGVEQVGVVAGLDGLFPVKVLELGQVVGDALQVVAGQDLLVVVVEGLSAHLAGGDAVLLAVHPEGHVQVSVGVVGVDADVLGEVAQELLGVGDLVTGGPVGHLDIVDLALHLGAHEVHDVTGVQVQLGSDLVQGREDQTGAVVTVDDGHGEGIGELALVDVVAGPGGGLDEGVEVLGEVQDVEQSDHLLQLGVVVHVEDLAAGKHALLPHGHEVLDGPLVGVAVDHLLGVPGLAKGNQLGVHVLLADVPQQLQHQLLLLSDILPACKHIAIVNNSLLACCSGVALRTCTY